MAEVLPTPAQPWMAGANGAPMPPANMTTEPAQPEMADTATAGLSGNAPGAVTKAPAQPPEPHVSVARHILEALGGAAGPMGWAKSVIAGGLAGAANVGTIPEGGGALTGAARGVAGYQQLQRQQALDAQAKQKEQFEQKQKELQSLREDQKLKYESAYYSQLTASSAQKAQEEGGKFAQDQQMLESNYWDTVAQALGADKAAKLREAAITDRSQLTSDHANQIGGGTHTVIGNGEAHVPDKNDKYGGVFMPNEYDKVKIPETIKDVIKGYHVDDKGNVVPDYTDIPQGTSLGTAKMIFFSALKQRNELQEQVKQAAATSEAQSKAKIEAVNAEHAEPNAIAATSEAQNKAKVGDVTARHAEKAANLAEQEKGAELRHYNAETEKTEEETKQLKNGTAPGIDSLGQTFTPPPGGIKETNKVRDSFKKDADNLAKTEGTYNQFQDVLNDINAGKPVTGAASVVALFNAIGISAEPLQGKGFRINHSTVEEHANARGLGETVYQKLLKIKDGDVITPQQIKDYADIAMRSRHDAYVNKINEVRNAGVNPDFLLPRGNGRKIDSNTASIYYDSAAGGTPQEKAANARKAAQLMGWQ